MNELQRNQLDIDYDKRQLNLMLKSLISFENNPISLSTLVGNLEFLLNALEVVSEDWEEKFLDEITTLETNRHINP